MEMWKKKLAILSLFLTLLFIQLLPIEGFAQSDGQANNENLDKATQLLMQLSPAERVGQLFLITTDGRDAGENSVIAELIRDYHIGGIVLNRENNNFSDDPNVLQNAYDLISSFQKIEFDAKNQLIGDEGKSSFNNYIPLFIGISQNGDVYPYDQIIDGLTPIPSQMAIGATWNMDLAKNAGMVHGKELSSLGFNLLLGPSLDVSDTAYIEGKDDLGIRTFGGDPFWVGEMGKSFISGVRTGSNEKLAIVSKYFPGRGGSDRLPEEEVATVRKSLEQLKLIELAPFFKVTDFEGTDSLHVTDGLLLSHIRYQGFQGNIRATTKPVSFDQTAIEQLLKLSPISTWRERGGILISDDLGSPSIQKFFNPTEQFFDAKQIARNAFLAGNDVLYMDKLISTGDENRYSTYKNTIQHFVQKYKEDQAFADRVNTSVIRILALKYKLYPEFEFNKVVPREELISEIGEDGDLIFEIAKNSATLISPKFDQITDTISEPPQYRDRIIFFSDNLAVSQCSDCKVQDIIAVDMLQNEVISLYGGSGSKQINNQNLISYSFSDLQDYLDNPFNRPELETNLSRADWVIFVTHQVSADRPESASLKNFLSKKIGVLRNKKVVVFGFGAPYYYDATDISAFSAYYALYSKTTQFFKVAARILFQEITPLGSSPVSIPGVAYDLIRAMSPDPNQLLELFVDETFQEINPRTPEVEVNTEDEVGVFRLGDNLPVKTGIIMDHNGHPVPDGTVVRFLLTVKGENLTVQQVESITQQGVARALIKLQNPGLHEVKVTSEPAINSQILLLDISQEEGTIISAITPTPIPTETEEQPEIPIEPALTDELVMIEIPNNKLLEWIIIAALSWILGAGIYLNHWHFIKDAEKGYICITFIIGSLIAGIWLLIGLPGSFQRYGFGGYLSIISVTTITGVFFGLIVWFFFRYIKKYP